MALVASRRRSIFLLIALAAAAIAASLLYTTLASGAGNGNHGRMYEVSITNITKGQIISPAVVATHHRSLDPVFSLGAPASPELAKVAEDAVLDDLVAKLEGERAVANVGVLTGENGPILPGETASMVIRAPGWGRNLSLVAMLVTTNDAFIGLSGVGLPSRGGMYLSPGYDSGTEVNNEDCAFIPGPPCGNGGVRATDGAEGYVYISSGVHGIGDLVPADHDWHNPAAKITITRVNGGGGGGDDGGDDDDDDDD